MTFPWEMTVAPECRSGKHVPWCDVCHGHPKDHCLCDGGIPAFLRRDTDNRAPFMVVVAPTPQASTCTEPLPMPWSALPTTENTNHETTTNGPFSIPST